MNPQEVNTKFTAFHNFTNAIFFCGVHLFLITLSYVLA
jgi:hypothetical protein